ncbi:MAG TPA: histidinol-phosphate transaminase [Flavobacteriales bacterium]|nr:histidinol-phosphate transaminase [Flavobacteriales bacterium]
MEITDLVRPSILKLKPYSSARDEFKGQAQVYLDANENAFGSPYTKNYNRYPDPLQEKLKAEISKIKGVPSPHIFLGNGSDEAIDVLLRIFCEPGTDSVLICPPTYGMYKVSADINNVKTITVNLTSEFQLNVPEIMKAITDQTKLLFICTPNNPTGNVMHFDDVEFILNNFKGIVVIDEAYINYSRQRSYIQLLTEYENLVVLQTFSKAWGLAGIRLGMAFSTTVIVDLMNNVKPPYNISEPTQEIAIQAVQNIAKVNEQIKTTVIERDKLAKSLAENKLAVTVYPSDANFLLAKFNDATGLYKALLEKGIVVRNRSNVELCDNCLRITVGTADENQKLIEALNGLIVK